MISSLISAAIYSSYRNIICSSDPINFLYSVLIIFLHRSVRRSFSFTRFYVTVLKLGNPQKQYTVQVDTGSDISWIACQGCSGCPSFSDIYGIGLNFYDPSKSSTSSPMTCSDPRCSTLEKGSRTCAAPNSNSCTYWLQYSQDSSTQGYYISDILHTDPVSANSSIIFGCSMLQSGGLTHPEDTFDGIFGLGANGTVLSQLSSAGIVPMMFTICLDGSEDDASYLYFGEIDEADIIYAPLVPYKSRFCLNLQSLAVNDKKLSVNSSIFKTPTAPGAIFDSVITQAYLPHEAYHHFINAITSNVKPQIARQHAGFDRRPCFMTQASIDDAFPTVKLNFAGGAEMTIFPKNYLMLQHVGDNSTFEWCMAWLDGGTGSATVFGDIALIDKVLVHDLVNKRFGWKQQKCSVPVKFSSGQKGSSSLRKNNKVVVILVTLAAFVFVALILSICCVHRCK